MHLVSIVPSFEFRGLSQVDDVDYCAEGFEWDVDGRSNVAYVVDLTLAYGDGSCQLFLCSDRGGHQRYLSTGTYVQDRSLLGTALSGGVV